MNIHTVRKGLFLHSLEMEKVSPCAQLSVCDLILSYLGHVIVYTEQRETTNSKVTYLW